MEVLTQTPKSTTFIPLTEHQSATPESFYNGPPVLHYHSDRCKLIVVEDELANSPAIANLVNKSLAARSTGAELQQTNGNQDVVQRTVEDVDVWVTSDKLFLYSTVLETGLAIPYPSISLHAIQSLPEPSDVDASSQGLYMQLLVPSDTSSSSDDEPDSISITIIPTTAGTNPVDPQTAATAAAQQTTHEASNADPARDTTPVQALFTALSNCSNLHPDPVDEDEQEAMMQFEGGDRGDESTTSGLAGSQMFQAGLVQPGTSGNGLPPPMPGSGGWITAENMHEYFDEHGNWLGGDDDDGDGDDAEMVDNDVGDDNNNRQADRPDQEDLNDAAPLGPGAGTVRSRDERDGAGVGVGDSSRQVDSSDEAKWRRIG